MMSRLIKLNWIFALLVIIVTGCSNNDEPQPVDCNTSNLTLTLSSKSEPSSCGVNDGSIVVSASGGTAPYQYRLNSDAFGSASTFSSLGGGTFSVSVKDANDCERQLTGITLTAPASPVANSPTIVNQTNCLNANGSITVQVTGGTPPYQYQLGSGSFGTTGVFASLKAGNYTITIKDAANCSITVNGTITSATGVSYANDIHPILQANCIKSGCHNGDNGASRNWSIFTNVQAAAQAIKTRTGNKTMPADIAPTGLPQNEIDLIACWVNDGALNN